MLNSYETGAQREKTIEISAWSVVTTKIDVTVIVAINHRNDFQHLDRRST